MTDPARGRVRGLFRVLGAIFGALFVLAGAALVLNTSYGVVVGHQHLSHAELKSLELGLADLVAGGLFLRAAVTGRDPYVPEPD